jgi:hypothetical protein
VNQPMAAGTRALSLMETNAIQTPNAGFPSDLLDLYGEAMDRALGVEKVSLSAIVEMNSCALDTCERLTGDFVGMVAGAFATCMQVQLAWFTLMVPRLYEGKTSLAVAAPAGSVAAGGEARTQWSAGSLDDHMDVAIGAGSGDLLPGMALNIGRPGGRARTAEPLESGMDLAIGETAA